jgi:hypothetical protein
MPKAANSAVAASSIRAREASAFFMDRLNPPCGPQEFLGSR